MVSLNALIGQELHIYEERRAQSRRWRYRAREIAPNVQVDRAFPQTPARVALESVPNAVSILAATSQAAIRGARGLAPHPEHAPEVFDLSISMDNPG